MDALFIMLALVFGIVVGMGTCIWLEMKYGVDEAEVRKGALIEGRKQGRVNIMGYRVIGNPLMRAYLRDKLAGSSVREVVTHIQYVGLENFTNAVFDYATNSGLYNMFVPHVADGIMDLACIYEQAITFKVKADGEEVLVFDPYAPTPDLFMALYF
jgi:hypothetical protein